MNVRLDIQRLVLEGFEFTAHERDHLRAAAETELARLIAECGVSSDLSRGIAVPALRGTDLALTRDATPSDVGVAIARSVAGGVANGGTTK
jgi:hypothetical protein